MNITTTSLKQSTILCLFVCCFCCNFRPTHPFVFQRIASPQHGHHCQTNIARASSLAILHAQNDPENQSKDDDEEDIDPVEEFLAMEEASNRVNQRLMMPRMIFSSIGKTVQFLAYGYLILSFTLGAFGYAIINDGDMIRIGSLEERDFLMEIAKSMKDK